jgi:hypothetical protein
MFGWKLSGSSAKPLYRAMLSHRLGRRWQLSAVCMALHDTYKGSPCFHRVGQSAGVILPYRNDHNIAKDFVALCKLVLNNFCPSSCYQNHVDRLGRVRNLRRTIYCTENGFVVHIRHYEMSESVIRGIYRSS